MATEWKTVSIPAGLKDEAEEIAQKLHYPNVSQYVSTAVRDRVEKDKEALDNAK